MRFLVVLALLLFSLPVFAGEVDDLLQLLDAYNRDRVVRLEIVRRLEKIGPDARRALPALRKVAEHDEFDDVRAAARRAVRTLTSSS